MGGLLGGGRAASSAPALLGSVSPRRVRSEARARRVSRDGRRGQHRVLLERAYEVTVAVARHEKPSFERTRVSAQVRPNAEARAIARADESQDRKSTRL